MGLSVGDRVAINAVALDGTSVKRVGEILGLGVECANEWHSATGALPLSGHLVRMDNEFDWPNGVPENIRDIGCDLVVPTNWLTSLN